MWADYFLPMTHAICNKVYIPYVLTLDAVFYRRRSPRSPKFDLPLSSVASQQEGRSFFPPKERFANWPSKEPLELNWPWEQVERYREVCKVTKYHFQVDPRTFDLSIFLVLNYAHHITTWHPRLQNTNTSPVEPHKLTSFQINLIQDNL